MSTVGILSSIVKSVIFLVVVAIDTWRRSNDQNHITKFTKSGAIVPQTQGNIFSIVPESQIYGYRSLRSSYFNSHVS